jgi:NADH dehydrogenase FAD-containing subunit
LGQARPRIVIIGGGFGGATCARALHRADPQFEVTLVEPNPTFTACPFSNAVIAGLRDMAAQRFGYDAIRAEGIAIAQDQATTIDPQARRISLRGGSTLEYDRLVLAPGIAIRWDALPGCGVSSKRCQMAERS